MEGQAAHHLSRVLRAQTGQLYELSDGEQVWVGRIESVGRDRVQFALVEELPVVQPRVEVTLLLSVVKFDAFEWAIEKATELAVSTIVPLAAERGEKALLTAAARRAERWKKILLQASQQCRRVRVPALGELAKAESIFGASKNGLRVMLSERAIATPLHRILEDPRTPTLIVAIAREGGGTDGQVRSAGSLG